MAHILHIKFKVGEKSRTKEIGHEHKIIAVHQFVGCSFLGRSGPGTGTGLTTLMSAIPRKADNRRGGYRQ